MSREVGLFIIIIVLRVISKIIACRAQEIPAV